MSRFRVVANKSGPGADAEHMVHVARVLERERVVAWLRTFEVIRGGSLSADEDADHEALVMVIADAIERGDHTDSAGRGASSEVAAQTATRPARPPSPITGAEFVDQIHAAIPDAFSEITEPIEREPECTCVENEYWSTNVDPNCPEHGRATASTERD